MSETSLNVTPGTGGPNVDLFSLDNGNVRQAIVIGDPTSSTKVAPVDNVNGLTVSSLKDLNRVRVVLSADAVASVAAEAMITFQSYKAGIVATGITSYTVTTGKTFRLQALELKIRPATPSTTVTFANTVFRFREGSTITSPLIMSFPVLMQTNTDSNPTTMSFPDGLEFSSGTVLGMSHLASATTILESFIITGYEY